MKTRIGVIAAIAALSAGCASDGWTRADTVAEVSWQVLNVIDAKQTANIQYTPGIAEKDPLTRAILGDQPATSDTYQLMATYGVSHYLISRALPAKWRKHWHTTTIVPKAYVIYNNERIGL